MYFANVSAKNFSLFFADDSSLFLSGNKPDDLISEMNNEMEYITDWLSTNKLSLNIDETHYMLFKSKGRYSVITKDLIINEVKISQVEKTKFLGVYINNVLSWKDHIQYIEGKIARSIGAVIKARKVFNQETLRTLYYTFIYPCFNYCLEAWGNTYSSYLDPLSKLQNRALRVITGSPWLTRLAPLYSNPKLFQFPKIYICIPFNCWCINGTRVSTEYISVIFLYKFLCFWAKYPTIWFITYAWRKT